jgi:hypothetical protein
MTVKEKGRRSDPIPNAILAQDFPESSPSLINLQASRLVRLYAVNASMAEALAPLIFLEMVR